MLCVCVVCVAHGFGHLPDHSLGDGQLEFLVHQFVELVQTTIHQLHEYPHITLHTHTHTHTVNVSTYEHTAVGLGSHVMKERAIESDGVGTIQTLARHIYIHHQPPPLISINCRSYFLHVV